MKEQDLKNRTKYFALGVIYFVQTLSSEHWTRNISNQLARSATSVGANYRAACRARSKADFIAKLSVVEEELDESMYWLEILEELKAASSNSISKLHCEANELISIVVASIKTLRSQMTKNLAGLKPI